MGRRPKQYARANGDHNIRTDVPKNVWRVAERIGTMYGKTTEPGIYGMWLLLKRVGYLFEKGDAAWVGDVEFERALKAELNQHEMLIDGDDIDINKLHRSPKLKSGFVGVYANGKGFRAFARERGGIEKTLGTFSSALEAAHRRYLYYKVSDLPYGELEVEMDHLRRTDMHCQQLDDKALIREIIRHAEVAGTTHLIFGPFSASIIPTWAQDAPRPAVPAPAPTIGWEAPPQAIPEPPRSGRFGPARVLYSSKDGNGKGKPPPAAPEKPKLPRMEDLGFLPHDEDGPWRPEE